MPLLPDWIGWVETTGTAPWVTQSQAMKVFNVDNQHLELHPETVAANIAFETVALHVPNSQHRLQITS